MNQALRWTWNGASGGVVRLELINLQTDKRETTASLCYDEEDRRMALESFSHKEHDHNFRVRYDSCDYGKRFVRKLESFPRTRKSVGRKSAVCVIFDSNDASPSENMDPEEHPQDGEQSESNSEFLGDWLKQLQRAFAGMFTFPSLYPVKEEFLDVSRDPAGTSFVWEGWGSSLCWWANFVGGLPQSDMDFVLDLLFDPQKGLGLNIARYNIGGGADLSVDTNLRPCADIPGFKSSANSTYDWSADERQRRVLLAAKDRGADRFEAFSNSPPPWMTLSGSVTGNWKKGEDNLDSKHYDAFAEYLTDVVRLYEEEWNVHFDYLAPFNEPVEGFWNINRKKPAQEGCNFSVAAIRKVILKMKESLVRKGLSTEISGVDSWSLNTARVLRGLDEETIRHISQINVHTYIPFVQREGDARRTEVRRVVGGLKKKLWMSEYGPLHWRGSELDIALAVARHISLDINELQASAWCYWQVLEVPGKNFYWGLMHAEFDYKRSFCVELKKQYYVMMQFTRWIRPGFVIYPEEGNFRDCLVIAVDSTSHATLVLVFTNTSDRNRDISFDSSSIAHELTNGQIQAALFRTSESENHEQLPTLYFETPILTARMAAKSITTVVISK